VNGADGASGAPPTLLDRLQFGFAQRLPREAVREVLSIWGLCFLGLLVAKLSGSGQAKLVATLGFLYLPLAPMLRRNEDYPDFGLTLRNWREDLRLAGLVLATVLPIFVLGYSAFVHALPQLPATAQALLAPYVGAPHFALRLPPRFPEWIIDQLFVVALPEEFFYRGYVQTRLRDALPQGVVLWGARLGPAFWWTAVLFALGHLAIFEVWRLGVFFPALLFGWLRERTGSVLGAALVHACANLLMQVLEASFFG
jgi:uncharacterized protein